MSLKNLCMKSVIKFFFVLAFLVSLGWAIYCLAQGRVLAVVPALGVMWICGIFLDPE